MKTIAIDSNIYKGAESYAKLHNISVTAAIEKAISLFLQKVQPKQKLLETAEFNDALSYVKTLKAKVASRYLQMKIAKCKKWSCGHPIDRCYHNPEYSSLE